MAANVPGVTLVAKVNALAQALNLSGGHVLKAALYFQNSGIGPFSGVYTATGEVTGTNYTAGGIVIPNATGVLFAGTTAYWTPSGNLSWPNLTISSAFDTALIYDTQATNATVMVMTFAAQTITATTFNIIMPANTSTSALLQIN